MTAFSPGLAQGCFELLELIMKRSIPLAHIAAEFPKIGVMPSAQVVEVSQILNWLRTTADGNAFVTVEGERILSSPDYIGRVRQALLDYVDVIHPAWLQNATFGRSKVIRFAGSGISQLFVEAELATSTAAAVVEFWDALAARARGQRDISRTQTGRKGERLTIVLERERTGREPKWMSVNSNSDGYDVLSVADRADGRPLAIEVKATTVGLTGSFHVTANEWEKAQLRELHNFHLWDISGTAPALAVLSVTDVTPHMPENHGEGAWESVEIPYTAFSDRFAPTGLPMEVGAAL